MTRYTVLRAGCILALIMLLSVLVGEPHVAAEGGMLTPDQWTKLTSNPYLDSYPDWSPDGSTIAWCAHSNGWNRTIWTKNLNEGSEEPLTFGSVREAPDYSPDSQQIVFGDYWNDSRYDIVVKDLPTGVETPIKTTGYNVWPRWSPKDTRILFSSAPCLECTYHIYTMKTDGTDIQQLTFEGWLNLYPQWSPDGSWIAFSSDRAGSSRGETMDIYVMDSNGGNVVQIGPGIAPVWRPPAGDYFAYQLDWHTHVMRVDGTGDFQLTDSTGMEFHHTWSPDGSRLAFAAEVNGSRDIYVVDVPLNSPPTASTGGPYNGLEGMPIALNGATATDADGDALDVLWSIDSAECAFTDPTALQLDLVCQDNGIHTAMLQVDDGINAPVTVETPVTVANVAPTLGSIALNPEDPVVAVGTPVSFGASFTDPAGVADEPYYCNFDWDGNGTVDETIETAYSTCHASHAYGGAGVYTVRLTVTDKDGADSNESIFAFVVAYDSVAGFVTGGGWIMSPVGACYADPNLEGKATFGFVSKYQKGATVPAGNTEFQFHASGFSFHSTAYNWLVVNQAGTNAQFKGSGTVNGSLDPNGNAFKFMLWASDGAPDTFRIRIWWEASGTENVVYDNGASQPIGGGSIVVHTGK